MKIKVSDIPDEGLDIEDEDSFETEEGVQGRTKLRARLERAGKDVFIHGEATAALTLSCSRCLRKFETGVSIPLDLAYCPEAEEAGSETHELTADEMDTGFYRDEEIDLFEVAREQVLLSLPMKPLCAETCKGICPMCGADLNEAPCGCEAKTADPRFQALKKYFDHRKE